MKHLYWEMVRLFKLYTMGAKVNVGFCVAIIQR